MDHLVFEVYAGCLDVNSCGAQDLKAKAFGSSATGVVGCNLSKKGGLVLSVSHLDSHSKVHFKLSINYNLFIYSLRKIRRVHRVLGGHQQDRDHLVN